MKNSYLYRPSIPRFQLNLKFFLVKIEDKKRKKSKGLKLNKAKNK